MPLKDTIQQTAKDEVRGVTALSKAAIESGTYLYPFKGILYFVTHRQLWKPLTSRLLPLLTLSVGVVVPMFLFTYIPQSFILTFVNGPLAWISTIALVLSESSTIITALSKAYLVDEALIDTFDLVLLSQNLTSLVKNGRELRGTSGGLGKLLKKPFAKFSPQALVRYFMWLPLNFVPVLGTILFLFVQGRQQGPAFHTRYFQLKSYTQKQRDEFVERNKPKYIAFGTAAMLLQLIPGASILFLYTNTVGAALWAVELERRGVMPEGEDWTRREVGKGGMKEL
ncbi:hypothetical protein BDD12DRAFT_738168 [Trichophaea hybrida]|nr:hypothetical protein BDD12DRAFT_738168 [Trichophaea hybrida]